MSGLTIILMATDVPRARAALTLAAAQAALGGRVRLYAHERAVTMLRAGLSDADAADLAAAGLPDLPSLLAMARDTGATMIACQTGMAMTGIALGDLAPGVEAGGMIGLLADLRDDRLVTI